MNLWQRNSKPKPIEREFVLKTTDETVLAKHLVKVDSAWVGQGLIFIGGKLIKTELRNKAFELIYDLVSEGIVGETKL